MSSTQEALSSDLNRHILSDVAVHMKYAKYSYENKRRETFKEIIDRNKQMNIKKFPFLKEEIEKNYVNVYEKKNLPSMRSLQFGGKPIEITPSRIYNCSYLPIDDYRAFSEVMFLLLGGVGVGYSVQAHHVEMLPNIHKPSNDKRPRRFLISDSIEGWADAIKVLMKSYFFGGSPINFDYSDIRPKGALLVTSGGKAPGPDPLKYCIEKIRTLLDSKADGEKLKSVEVHDIVCHIADAVLAGGIRRAALIALFSKEDEEMLLAKGNFEVLSWDYATVDAGVDTHGEPRKAKVEHVLNGEKYFDLRLVYKDPSYGIIETVCYWTSEKDIETFLKPESKLPWYCFQPQRGRANNSVILERDKITEVEFKNLWKSVENSKAGEPGFYFTNNKDWGTNPCFTGDTKVALANGKNTTITLKEMSDTELDYDVYTLDNDGNVVIRKMRNVHLTRKDAKILKITLDNGQEIRCTEDHKFRLYDGTWIEAKDLENNTRLWSMNKYKAGLFSKKNSTDYWWINSKGRNKIEHRAIYENIHGPITKGNVIHHIDINSLNNSIENLIEMTPEDHNELHASLMKGENNPINKIRNNPKKWNSWRNKIVDNATGENNPMHSGISNEELKKMIYDLTEEYGRMLFFDDLYERFPDVPKSFSKYRKEELVSYSNLFKESAKFYGFNVWEDDTRTVKRFIKFIDMGYDCELVSGEIIFTKKCEITGEIFKTTNRAQCVKDEHTMSYATKKWYEDDTNRLKFTENLRESHLRRKEKIKNRQAKLYNDLKMSLNRDPFKKEWAQHCLENSVSAEISRESSPFRTYNDLKEYASLQNHRVISVEFSGYEDVYDGTVDEFHNFFIGGLETQTKAGKEKLSFVNVSNCCEIALKPNSFCNLCEVNMLGVSSQEDLNSRVKSAAFIGTLQASYTDFHYLRSIWQKTAEKDALLGIGLTGIASCDYKNLDFTEAAKIAVEENKRVAELIGINPAARVTTIKPSGTSSTVLGTSSGIHAWHNDYYLRRIRVKKNESIYTYLLINHPELVEDDVMDVTGSAVISVPIKAPENSILRTESPLETLERIKYFYNNWILPGHNTGDNTHNISATISIKPEEWKSVGEWMWTNRDCYNGISVLDYDGGTYKQAPFEDITKEEYERLTEKLTKIDLSNVVELEDNTNLNGEIACAGGACEVTY